MPGFSDYVEAAVLNHLFGTTTFSKPSGRYVALFTAAPSDSGGGTEVSGGSYARQSVTLTISGTTTSATNSSVITFPDATSTWGTITHFAIFDAVTSGNMLTWGALASSRSISTDDSMIIRAGSLTVTLD